jgi:hypothetical protein
VRKKAPCIVVKLGRDEINSKDNFTSHIQILNPPTNIQILNPPTNATQTERRDAKRIKRTSFT